MKTVGLFDAKTRLSELCREVAETGETILIERRGRPIAELSLPRPAPKDRPSILADIARFNAEHPRDPDEPDFPDVWLERSMPGPNPLE
jgi:antitoxin (DNA-binding transcriptional repressor) of toxin-antitoxin stability system